MANKRDKKQPHQQQSDMGKGTFDKGEQHEPQDRETIKHAGEELGRDDEKNLGERE